MGGGCLLDSGKPAQPLDLAALRDLFADRVGLAPVLRQRVQEVPFGLDQPHWVDDKDFDLEFHVREIALPRPGSDAQLAEQVSRLQSRPLDRTRPLWETYLISGLAKRRQAVYTKIHHAAIDGVSGAEVLTLLLDLTPAGRPPTSIPAFRPERPPGPAWMLTSAGRAAALRPLDTVRITRDLIRFMPALASIAGLHRLPPFNLVISNVPGPDVQACLAGAKLLAYYPVSVTDGQGLNMTVHGYRGGLHFGLIACRELVPDVDELTGYLVEELSLLLKGAADLSSRRNHTTGRS